MFQLYFWIIVGILVFDFLFGWVLDTLNAKAWKEEVPEPLIGMYDRDKYAKSQHYFRDNLKFGRITSVFSLSIMLAMLFSGGFGFLDQKLQPISSSQIEIVDPCCSDRRGASGCHCLGVSENGARLLDRCLGHCGHIHAPDDHVPL